MAIQISGTTVINNQAELATGLVSAYDTVTAGGSTAVTNRTVYYVTSAGQTVTLPISPSVGNEVIIVVGNFTTTNIDRNGSNIMGIAENIIIDRAYSSIKLIYVDATRGWIIC